MPRPIARKRGIFAPSPDNPYRAVCSLCGRSLVPTALAMAAHGQRHVREGVARRVTEFTDIGPRGVYEAVPSTEARHAE